MGYLEAEKKPGHIQRQITHTCILHLLAGICLLRVSGSGGRKGGGEDRGGLVESWQDSFSPSEVVKEENFLLFQQERKLVRY